MQDVDPHYVVDQYLELLKGCLTRAKFEDGAFPVAPSRTAVGKAVRKALAKRRLELVRTGTKFDAYKRQKGQDWPLNAETMVGMDRLDNVHNLLLATKHLNGAFVECGIWRGGVCIFARKFFDVYGEPNRAVIGFDSFEGLPEGGHYEQDAGDPHHKWHEFAVSMDQVKANANRYGAELELVKGWFRDTVYTYATGEISVLRVDGDMYEGTMDPLRGLYDKVQPGGYVIIDDYGAVRGCRQATDEFREERGITAPLQQVDWTAVYWKVE